MANAQTQTDVLPYGTDAGKPVNIVRRYLFILIATVVGVAGFFLALIAVITALDSSKPLAVRATNAAFVALGVAGLIYALVRAKQRNRAEYERIHGPTPTTTFGHKVKTFALGCLIALPIVAGKIYLQVYLEDKAKQAIKAQEEAARKEQLSQSIDAFLKTEAAKKMFENIGKEAARKSAPNVLDPAILKGLELAPTTSTTKP